MYEKGFHPAYTSIIMMPVVHSTGKTSTVTMIPIPFFHPDSWSVSFKAFDEKENVWRERTVYVSKEVYDVVNTGMWYEVTDKDLDEAPKIRQK